MFEKENFDRRYPDLMLWSWAKKHPKDLEPEKRADWLRRQADEVIETVRQNKLRLLHLRRQYEYMELNGHYPPGAEPRSDYDGGGWSNAIAAKGERMRESIDSELPGYDRTIERVNEQLTAALIDDTL